MIKILNPHSHHHSSPTTTTTLKTAEILSKYRPIAPKPETPPVNDDDPSSSSSSMSHKISQSPYLRTLWPQLQARPTRTRKRGRGSMAPPPSLLGLKRSKTTPATAQHVLGFSGVQTLSFQAFPRVIPSLAQVGYALENVVGSSALVTLPLLQCSPAETKCMMEQGPSIATSTTTTTENRVIAPQPIRPIGSRISVARFDH